MSYERRICQTCRNEFGTRSAHARFCSDRCRFDYHKKTDRYNDRLCFHCREPFKVKRKQQRFCSVKCRDLFHRDFKRQMRAAGAVAVEDGEPPAQ